MNYKFAIATMVMAIASTVWAQNSQAEQLLSDMRAAYQKPQTIHIKTQATLLMEAAKSPQTMHFDLTFKRPYKVYCKVTQFPGQEGKDIYWVTDGKTLKSTGPEGTRKGTIKPDEIGKGWPINLECLSFWDSDRQLSTKAGANMEKSKFVILENEAWNGKEWTVLEETAFGQDVFVRYFIDPKTFYIWRCEVWDLERKTARYDIKVTELEIDPVVDDKIFDISKEIVR
ncbi:MAG: hypothetical protein KF784_05110 [Fimbriimonadaceae bacterium]|nr:hypothetical protein [Fimbriimonadaceae bacterium]